MMPVVPDIRDVLLQCSRGQCLMQDCFVPQDLNLLERALNDSRRDMGRQQRPAYILNEVRMGQNNPDIPLMCEGGSRMFATVFGGGC